MPSGQVASSAELVSGTASVKDLQKNWQAFPQLADDDSWTMLEKHSAEFN